LSCTKLIGGGSKNRSLGRTPLLFINKSKIYTNVRLDSLGPNSTVWR